MLSHPKLAEDPKPKGDNLLDPGFRSQLSHGQQSQHAH